MSTTLEQPPIQEPKPHRDRRTLIIVVLAVLLVIATATVVAITVFSGGTKPSSAPSTPSAAGPATTGASSAVQPTTASVLPPQASTSISSRPASFAYQPLWPFANLAEVEAWQNAYRAGGHSPWHLDANLTALAFTTGYLKFTGIDVVVSQSVQGSEALVAVGYPIENNAPGTAAVLHLAKYGTGADAPWEVVGSKDTTLTITQPRYGTAVRSPFTVGGRVTGVDENIRVEVREPSVEQPIGQTAGLPAGGQNTRWSTTVAYEGATSPVLTVVAFTGGHYTDVERFAITGVGRTA